MKDPSEVFILCQSPDDIARARNVAMNDLAPEFRKRLSRIVTSYLHRYGIEGVFDRLNNRSVAQVFEQFEGDDGSNVIVEGEREGLRFRLSEKPPTPDE